MKEPFQGFAPLTQRILKYDAAVEILKSMLITGCYWGSKEYLPFWAQAIQRVAQSERREGTIAWTNLTLYPALLLQYAAGLSCLANSQYSTLAKVLNVTMHDEGIKKPFYYKGPTEIINPDSYRQFYNSSAYTPVSDLLHEKLREDFRDIIPEDDIFDNLFDWLEYLRSLLVVDYLIVKEKKANAYGPIGRFRWHKRGQSEHISQVIHTIILRHGENFELLKAGLFGGDLSRLVQAKAKFDTYMREVT